MTAPSRRPAWMPAWGTLVLASFAVWLAACGTPGRLTPRDTRNALPEHRPEQLSAEQWDAVCRFAPVILHEAEPEGPKASWDFITSFDFDGDLVGANNEENLRSAKHELLATVYFSLLETPTHLFITYSLYHPLDWSRFPHILLGMWHENDMESIQVVVERQFPGGPAERPVLLAVQRHLRTSLHSVAGAKIASGAWQLDSRPLHVVGEDLDAPGTHPVVHVEKGGHAIRSVSEIHPPLASGTGADAEDWYVFRPPARATSGPDRWLRGKRRFTYRLVPVHDTLWAMYRTRSGLGEGRCLDGYFHYRDGAVSYQYIPRHFDSDRWSTVGKRDSGILPFAFSHHLLAADLGALFFDPAEKYWRDLRIRSSWSRRYTYHPYRPRRAPRGAEPGAGELALGTRTLDAP